MKISQFNLAFDCLFSVGITPLVVGHRGVGKSETLKQYASKNGHYLADFRVGQMADPADLIGLFDLIKGKEYTEFRMPKRIFDLIQWAKNNPDKYAIFMFDEANRGTKDILQAIFEVILDNSLNGNVFPQNVRSVLLINPPTPEYDVINFNDSAFLDRTCALKFEPSKDEWIDYAVSKEFDPSVVDFIREVDGMLEPQLSEFSFNDENGINILPSRRSNERLSKVKKWFDNNNLDNITENEVFLNIVQGIIGPIACIAYKKFLENYDKTLQADDILNDFKKHQKTIEKYSSVEHSRTDILSQINDRLIEKLKPLETLNKASKENLKAYIMTLPVDISHSFLFHLTNLKVVNLPKEGLAYDAELLDFTKKTKNDIESLKKDAEKKDNKDEK